MRNSYGIATVILLFYSKLNEAENICGCEDLESRECRPKIQILEIEPSKEDPLSDSDWKNEQILLYENSTAVFECSSKHPISWNFEHNFIHTQDLINIEHKRSFTIFKNESTYCYTTKLKLSSVKTELVGKYTCQSHSNANSYSSFHLFVPDMENIKLPFYLQAGKDLKITTNKMDYKLLIPCAVSSPSQNFYLQKIDGIEPRVVEAAFIPYKGFEVTNTGEFYLEGSYVCVVKGQEGDAGKSVKVQVVNTDFYISPVNSNIFTKDNLTVKCSSSEVIRLEIDETGGLKEHTITYKTEPNNMFSHTAILEYKLDTKSPFTGNIICAQEKNNIVIKKWAYHKVDMENGISFDYESNIIKCQAKSPYKVLSVSLKYCPSPELCQLYKKFLSKIDYNNTEKVKLSSCGENCLQILLRDIQRVGGYAVSCYIDKFTLIQTFFIGLDKKLYSNMGNASQNALIQMEEEKSVFDWKSNIVAECRWLLYLFGDSCIWAIVKRDGDMEFIGQNFATTYEYNGTMISKLEYSNKNSSTGILRCYVGLRNSSQWIFAANSMTGEFDDDLTTPRSALESKVIASIKNFPREISSCPSQTFAKHNSELSSPGYYHRVYLSCFVVIMFFLAVNTVILSKLLIKNSSDSNKQTKFTSLNIKPKTKQVSGREKNDMKNDLNDENESNANHEESKCDAAIYSEDD